MVFCVTLFRLIFTSVLLLSGAFCWEIFLLKGANYQYPTISAFVDYSYARRLDTSLLNDVSLKFNDCFLKEDFLIQSVGLLAGLSPIQRSCAGAF